MLIMIEMLAKNIRIYQRRVSGLGKAGDNDTTGSHVRGNDKSIMEILKMSLVIRQCNSLPEGMFALLTRTRNGEQVLRHLECWQTWQTNRLTSRSVHLCSGLTCVSEEVAVVRGDHSGVGVVEAVAAVVAPGGNDQRRVAVGQLRLP